MTSEIAIVIGMLLLALSMPSIIGAYAERRRPRMSGLVLCGAVGFLVFAYLYEPDGLQLSDIPNAFINVAAVLFF